MTGNKIEDKGESSAMQQINSALEKLDMGMQYGSIWYSLYSKCNNYGNKPKLKYENEPTVHLGYMLKENQCILKLGVSPCVI